MGILTDHVAQLCGEIVEIRKQRQILNQGLTCETLRRKSAVNDLCATFADSRRGMARRMSRERQAFLRDLRRTVHAQMRNMQVDLAGVRSAWAGR